LKNLFQRPKIHGIIIVCDITFKSSYNSIPDWIKKIQENAPKDVVTIVVGSKIDLDPERKISKFEAEAQVKEFNLPYFEVSAKSGENVNESFMFLVRKMYQKMVFLFSSSSGDIKKFTEHFEDENIDINWKSQFEETPLFIACKNGRFEIVEYMLAGKRELDILSKNAKGILPLQIAKINSKLQEKLDHEKEEIEAKQRQTKCLSIYNLLQKYQSDPKKVKIDLRKKLNLKGISSDFYFFIKLTYNSVNFFLQK